MRPISLEIAGLHSFRERRTIDFEPLLQDQLFGIFGPTGGGKSTILDAMTLALFGKIERTKGQEIASAVNSRARECSVALTFALRQEGEERRYRVERTYKVQKSGMKSEARLVDLSADPPVVLADKGSEVSGMVENILGIRAHDFRLSVVLPQGAFAEFLHLRPKDRGEMLQRIFGLEELGNRLNTRLRELRAGLESRRAGVEARLESLNEYNDEALSSRREELELAIATAERERLRVAEAEQERNNAEELYGLIAERDHLLSGRAERQSERERLEHLHTRLQRAEEATTLESLVQVAQEEARRLQEAQTRYNRAEHERGRAEERLEPLRRRKEDADRQKGETGKVTILEKQIRRLEEIAGEDERILLLARSVANRTDRITRSEAMLEKSRIAVAQGQEMEARAQNDLKALRITIDSLADEERDLAKRKEVIERLERLSEDREEQQNGLKKIAEEEAELSDTLGRLAQEIGKAQEEELLCTATLEIARRSLDEARVENALGEAASLLHDGEPCPLCGSTEHPHPYTHAGTRDLNLPAAEVRNGEEERTAAAERLRSLEKEEASVAARLAGTSERRREIEKDHRQTVEEMDRQIAGTDYNEETDIATLRRRKEELAEGIARTEKERTKAKERVEEFEENAGKAVEATAREREAIVKLEQVIASEKEEFERETNELRDLRERRKRRLEEIGIDLPEGSCGDAVAERKNDLQGLKEEIAEAEEMYEQGRTALEKATREYDLALALCRREEEAQKRTAAELEKGLREKGFGTIAEWEKAFMSGDERAGERKRAEEIAERLKAAERRLSELTEKIGGRTMTADRLARCRSEYEEALRRKEESLTALGKAEQAAEECGDKNAEWKKIAAEGEETAKEYAMMKKLSAYLQGNAFINFLADEHLQHICRTASNQLLELTGGRLAIGSRSDEGFFIRDNGNGGTERPPGSLSGGETFLVSLALSLALSDSLQSGRAPMEFFFLDEGFGTLDDDLLELVLDSLERLRATSQRAIGVISHVGQLRERIHRRLIVTPAGESAGTNVRLEMN